MKENILQGKYASSVSANENENQIQDTTNSSSSNELNNKENSKLESNEEYERLKNGYDLKMTNADKILNFRKTIENFNASIIEELNPLFFALF